MLYNTKHKDLFIKCLQLCQETYKLLGSFDKRYNSLTKGTVLIHQNAGISTRISSLDAMKNDIRIFT